MPHSSRYNFKINSSFELKSLFKYTQFSCFLDLRKPLKNVYSYLTRQEYQQALTHQYLNSSCWLLLCLCFLACEMGLHDLSKVTEKVRVKTWPCRHQWQKFHWFQQSQVLNICIMSGTLSCVAVNHYKQHLLVSKYMIIVNKLLYNMVIPHELVPWDSYYFPLGSLQSSHGK